MDKVTLFIALFFCSTIWAQKRPPVLNWIDGFAPLGSQQAAGMDKEGSIYLFHQVSNYIDTISRNPLITDKKDFCVGLRKVNSNGNVIWTFVLSQSSDWIGFGNSVVDDDGNSYISGYFNDTLYISPNSRNTFLTSSSPNDNDIFLIKYNEHGELVWGYSFGSSDYDFTHGISLKDNGNIVLSISGGDSIDLDPSVDTAYLPNQAYTGFSEYTPTGAFVSAKNTEVSLYELDCDKNEDIICYGSFQGNTTFCDYFNLQASSTVDRFIGKVDKNYQPLWVNTLSSGEGGLSRGCVITDHDNNIILTGHVSDTLEIKHQNGIDSIYALSNHYRGHSTDVCLIKFNPDGELIWAYSLGSLWSDNGYTLKVDSDNNIYLTGIFGDSIDLDPDTSSYYLPGANSDAFIAKYTPDAHLEFAFSINNYNSFVRCNSILLDEDRQHLVICGNAGINTDFDKDPYNYAYYNSNKQSNYIVSYDLTREVPPYLPDYTYNSIRPDLTLFPNPSDDYIYLDLNEEVSIDDIKQVYIHTPLGQRTNRSNYFHHTTLNTLRFDISDLASGSYYLTIYLEKNCYTYPFYKH